jgi:hypothetical protein
MSAEAAGIFFRSFDLQLFLLHRLHKLSRRGKSHGEIEFRPTSVVNDSPAYTEFRHAEVSTSKKPAQPPLMERTGWCWSKGCMIS